METPTFSRLYVFMMLFFRRIDIEVYRKSVMETRFRIYASAVVKFSLV